MPADYLHNHHQFADLIRIVAQEKGIDPALVEKDYWIMHCLYGLQQLGLTFQLKGGTSLSKGFKCIDRFSEDIDILIEPPADRDVKTGPNHDKAAHIESRRKFYDWLANEKIRIGGFERVERDTTFDNDKLTSAGIRLFYPTHVAAMKGLKESGQALGASAIGRLGDFAPISLLLAPRDGGEFVEDLHAELAAAREQRTRSVGFPACLLGVDQNIGIDGDHAPRP